MFFQTAKRKAVNVWRYSMIWLQSVAVCTKDEKAIEDVQLQVINWI
jgi:hypothetical protein